MLASASFLNPFTTSTVSPPITPSYFHSDISHKLRPPVVDPNKFQVRFEDDKFEARVADFPYFPDDDDEGSFIPSEQGWVGLNVASRQKKTLSLSSSSSQQKEIVFPDEESTVRKQIFRTDNLFEKGQREITTFFIQSGSVDIENSAVNEIATT